MDLATKNRCQPRRSMFSEIPEVFETNKKKVPPLTQKVVIFAILARP
jgi:hypothetical protein